MRAGVLAPIAWRALPRYYGPWELFAFTPHRGRSLAVTMWTSRARRLPDPRRAWPVVPCGWSEDSTIELEGRRMLYIAEIFEHADEFDIVYNGFDFLPLTYTALVDTPVVTTIHGLSSDRIIPEPPSTWTARPTSPSATPTATRAPRSWPPSITASTPTPSACTWHLHIFKFLRRIHPDKGTVEAIDAAQAAGLPIRIAGIVQDEAYFTAKVAPASTACVLRSSAVGRRTKRVPRRRSRAAAPHQLRRAFRIQRGRGHGQRYARHRLRPWLDGVSHPGGSMGYRARCRGSRRRHRLGERPSTDQLSAPSPSSVQPGPHGRPVRGTLRADPRRCWRLNPPGSG